MKNLKILIIAGTIIAVAAITTMIYLVATKNPTETSTNNAAVQGKSKFTEYSFGYKLDIPKLWDNYRTAQVGQNITFFIPVKDTAYIQADGKAYAPVVTIAAITKQEVKDQEKLCAQEDPNRYWMECLAIENKIGDNNYFRIAWYGPQDGPTDFQTRNISEEVQSVLKSIELFDLSGEPDSLKYEDLDYGISFYFQNQFFSYKYGEEIYLPFGQNEAKYSLFELVHNIKTQHCALSGVCTPTTDNLKIGLIFLEDQTIDKIRKSSIGDQLVSKKFDNRQGWQLSQGVEGEGMNYYFFDAKDKGVLMFYQTYLDENILTNYKTTKDFIPYERQQSIMAQILRNFTLENDPKFKD